MEKCKNCGNEFEGKFCPECGMAVGSSGTLSQNAPIYNATVNSQPQAQPASYFTGGAFSNAFTGWLALFVGAITLGLAYPAMFCWKCRWEARHTFINGRRLTFDGKAGQLIGNFLLWVLLSVITLGIYAITLGKMKMTAWKTKHTHFEGVEVTEDNKSKFTGKWYQLFGVNFLTVFVTLITLTFGYYWAHCYKERWYAKHKIIDGVTLYFDGTAGQYFGKRILWSFLSVITFGIYIFWLKVKSVKWTISHTHADEKLNALVPNYIADEKSANAVPAAQGNAQNPQNTLGLIGLILSLVMTPLGIVGLILSIVGLVKTGPNGNRAVSIAGIVFGVMDVIVIITALIILFVVVLPRTGVIL